MSLRSKTASINIKTYVQDTCIICRILYFSTVTSLITPCLIHLANKAEENKLKEDSLSFSLKHCYLLLPIREESWDWQITLQQRSQHHTSGDTNRKQTWNITLLRIPALGMVLGHIHTLKRFPVKEQEKKLHSVLPEELHRCPQGSIFTTWESQQFFKIQNCKNHSRILFCFGSIHG